MAQLNFPDPNDTQEFEAAGILWTWNDTLKVWSSETTTAFDAGDLYLSKRNDDAADGNIDFRGLTTHQQGVQLPNLTNAGSLATDVDGNIIAGTGSGGDGHDNQDLGYVSDGNNGGQVTITDGNPADIPVATDSVSGLFTGTEKQKLAGIADGATNTAYQNLGYNTNGDAAGTVTITKGNNAVIPVATNTVAGLFTGAERQKLNALLTTSQNDNRYLRLDSGAGNQTRTSNNTVAFTGSGAVIDIGTQGKDDSNLNAVPSLYVNKANCGMAYFGLRESNTWNGIKANHLLYGSAGTDSVTLGIYRAAANSDLKPTIRIGSTWGGTKTGILVRTAGDQIRVNTYHANGLEFCTRSTSGNNAAKAVTFYSKTGDSEYEAGWIYTANQSTAAKIYLKSKDGNAVGITTVTDPRNVVSSTPLPSAVNAVKALNPSVLTLSSGSIVTSFPLGTTKIHAPFAALGEETDVDEEGSPDYAGVDHARLVPLLTKALQEALERIEALEAQVNQPAG